MSEAIKQSTALTIIPASAISTIVGADKDDILGKLRAELGDYQPDGSTADGRKEIGSKAKKVGTAKQDLLRLAATLKADHQKVIKAVNAEERVIEEKMDAMRDAILAPRVAYETRDKIRVDAHEAAIKALTDLFLTLPAEAEPSDVLNRIGLMLPFRERQWEEFENRARQEYASTGLALKTALHRAQTREAEAAELIRLRAEAAEAERQRITRETAEREAEIARQAAETARLAAEAAAAQRLREAQERAEAEVLAAERRAQEAAQAAEAARLAAIAEGERLVREAEERAAEAAAQVERDRQAEEDRAAAAFLAEQRERERIQAEADRAAMEAEQRQRAQAERIAAAERQAEAARAQAQRDAEAAVERERQRVATEAEAARKEASKREADKKHKAAIHNDMMEDFIKSGLSDAVARAATIALAKGAVRHVSIRY